MIKKGVPKGTPFFIIIHFGDDVVGVRIAVRDVKKTNESQIYNWGIKKDATLGAVSGGNIPGQYPASSVASNSYIPQDSDVVNSENTDAQKNFNAQI